MTHSVFSDELMAWAREVHRGLSNPEHPVLGGPMGELRELALDIADVAATGDINEAAMAIGGVDRRLSQPGLITLCLAFTDVIGPSTVEQRADMHHLVDVFAFPEGKRGLARTQRAELRKVYSHGIGHAIAWLEFHDTDPQQAIAYWLLAAGGPYRKPVEPCALGLTILLACIASRRRRPRLELAAAPFTN